MFPIPLHNLNEVPNYNPITQATYSAFSEISTSRKRLMNKSGMCRNTHGKKNLILFQSLFYLYLIIFSHHFIGFYIDNVSICSFPENTSKEPAFYSGHFFIDQSSQIKDTFLVFNNWGKGVVFVNDFNLGRYWPVKYFLFTLESIIFAITESDLLLYYLSKLFFFFFEH